MRPSLKETSMTPPTSRRLSKDRRIVVAGAQFAVVPNDIPTNLYRCIYFLRFGAFMPLSGRFSGSLKRLGVFLYRTDSTDTVRTFSPS